MFSTSERGAIAASQGPDTASVGTEARDSVPRGLPDGVRPQPRKERSRQRMTWLFRSLAQ